MREKIGSIADFIFLAALVLLIISNTFEENIVLKMECWIRITAIASTGMLINKIYEKRVSNTTFRYYERGKENEDN